MAHICVEHGGSLSGEHGDGQARGELLPIMYGDELVQAFWEFKAIWDPRQQDESRQGRATRTSSTRIALGTATTSRGSPRRTSRSPEDHGSFAYAANRCVGTGKCRKHDAGTMCPSYMATREEKLLDARPRAVALRDARRRPDGRRLARRSRQGRARPVPGVQGLQGRVPGQRRHGDVQGGVSRRTTTRASGARVAAYAFGLMYWWARLASLAPGVVNCVTQTPGAARRSPKRSPAMAPQRRIPLFAPQTFRAWFAQREPRERRRKRRRDPVARHLEQSLSSDDRAGRGRSARSMRAFRSIVPHDAAVLRPAALRLRHARPGEAAARSDARRAATARFAPACCVVGLEPSCVSVFRDEMVDLLGPR